MNNEQKSIQEDEYLFPYHYLGLKCDDYRYLYHADYLGYLKVIIDTLGSVDSKKSILDAGCGDGRFTFEMNKRIKNANIIGIDYSDRALAFAKAFNPATHFEKQDLTKFNLKKKFDIIVLIEALEHIQPKDIDKILSRLKAHMKNTGKLIISVPSVNVPLHKKHFQHFSADSLRTILEKHFTVSELFGYADNGRKRVKFNILNRFLKNSAIS